MLVWSCTACEHVACGTWQRDMCVALTGEVAEQQCQPVRRGAHAHADPLPTIPLWRSRHAVTAVAPTCDSTRWAFAPVPLPLQVEVFVQQFGSYRQFAQAAAGMASVFSLSSIFLVRASRRRAVGGYEFRGTQCLQA